MIGILGIAIAWAIAKGLDDSSKYKAPKGRKRLLKVKVEMTDREGLNLLTPEE